MGTYISRVLSLHRPCSSSNDSQPIKKYLRKVQCSPGKGLLVLLSTSCPDAKNHCLLQWGLPQLEHITVYCFCFCVFVPWPNFLGIIVCRQLGLSFLAHILMLIGYKSYIYFILILFFPIWFAKMLFRICVPRDTSLLFVFVMSFSPFGIRVMLTSQNELGCFPYSGRGM